MKAFVAILINAHQISKSFTTRPLFTGLSFSIESGERIGLIGPNGAGKSTLLKILSGLISPDEGNLSIQKGLKVGYLEQVPQFAPNATIMSSVLEASHDPTDWQEISHAQEIMAKLSLANRPDFSVDTEVESLSGGWKKRVALARELLRKPDLLLLDEPTNHLDVESIIWLEELLEKTNFATITVTHDLYFLQKVAKRIIEIDRRYPNGLLSINSDYASFLEAKADLLAAQEQHEVKLKNTLRRETEWLRRGAKARQTKQQARIKATHELKKEVEDLTARNQKSSIRLNFVTEEKNPKKLIEAKNISKSYNSNVVVPPIDLTITPKTRLGLIGSNGCGKSTLIRLLIGEEAPDTGSIHHAEKLQVSYFEQNRESLNPEANILSTLSPNGDHVEFNGEKVHVKSYLSRFLFQYDQMDLPVKRLSGGEQSRLLIARLMLKKANLLVLDEPTNDLDMTTLGVLQEVLQEFNGAVILVTHDRHFMDQVANKILGFGINQNDEKEISSFADLSQWEGWFQEQCKLKSNLSKKSSSFVETKKQSPIKKKKLSYKEQRELDSMEDNIQKAEKRLSELETKCTKPEVISNAKKLLEITDEMAELNTHIEALYKRWAELESSV